MAKGAASAYIEGRLISASALIMLPLHGGS
jgi:hypothetical protein